ncbi:hypothetical protein F5Y14DRAFT_73982 [Nemania sp. NC0429]|nr:hypothetical protein F5Y14DRAFT_73982 [Nemania sp. NC0429]
MIFERIRHSSTNCICYLVSPQVCLACILFGHRTIPIEFYPFNFQHILERDSPTRCTQTFYSTFICRLYCKMRLFNQETLEYSLVPNETGNLSSKRWTNSFSSISRRLLFPLTVALSFCAGLLTTTVAQRSVMTVQKPADFNSELPLEGPPGPQYFRTTFTYNRTFGADPLEDPLTEDAWDSLVPLGQGTVRLSDSSQVYVLSVMHQLHCLWSIHQGFYRALHAEPTEVNLQDFPHIRHCFDYIRQALMCSADATLEPVDPVLGGVTGWNGTHVCSDFRTVAAWAEGHRTNNLKGFRGHHKAKDHHNSH